MCSGKSTTGSSQSEGQVSRPGSAASTQGTPTSPTGTPPGMSEAALKRVTADNCPTADELEKVLFYWFPQNCLHVDVDSQSYHDDESDILVLQLLLYVSYLLQVMYLVEILCILFAYGRGWTSGEG